MWKEQLVWAAFDKLHPIETFSMYFRRQGQVCVCVCLCSFFMATRVCVCVCVLHGYLLKKPLVGREVRTHRGP